MLLVPRSLTTRWSPFQPQVVEAESVIQACIDKLPAATAMSLSLTKIHQVGWRSPEAHRLYAEACEKLSNWCVQKRRYVHNVSTLQTIEFNADFNLCTERDRRRLEQPQRGWWPFPRQSEFDARRAERRQLEKFYNDLPNWTQAVKQMPVGEACLIAAPLSLIEGDDSEVSACLCDYPPFLRTPQDAAVALLMSDMNKQALLAKLGPLAAAWHPFCRVLGILHQEPQGLAVKVLQIELAIPVPAERNYLHKPMWDEALVKETMSFGFELREAEWAQEDLAEHQHGQMFRNFGINSGSNLLSLTGENDEEFLARMISLAESKFRAQIRRAGSPFEGRDAFWCALAVLLPAWKTQFALNCDKVTALLIAFDKTYGHEWQQVASNPALSSSLRYTPEIMQAARHRIAAMQRT